MNDIDRGQVIQYAIRCVIAGAVYGGALGTSLFLGHDMDAATKVATIAGGSVLAMLSHGTAFWAPSPKKQLPPVVNITSIVPPAMPVGDDELIPVAHAAPDSSRTLIGLSSTPIPPPLPTEKKS